ncbi:hypothetical protein ACFY8F_12150 [Streptomyces tanashiensis]|uniref:hypothetical protein n=1 Tax=Streptomyces tanashiensis TaxID=67367 RepID=UPI00369D838F
MKNRLLAATLTTALGLGLSVLGTPTASAQSLADCSFESSHVAAATLTARAAPGTVYPSVGSVAKGTVVCAYSTTTGGGSYTACGKTSTTWTRISPAFAIPKWVASACLKWPA